MIITRADWRAVFYVTGLIGIAWAVWWWYTYYPPERHPQLGADERRLLEPVMARGRAEEAAPPWLALLRFRQVWGLVVAKFLSDAAWYFYLFWLPRYLYDARAFDIKAVGAFAWIPLAAAGVGCLLGGWLSSYLLVRGLPLDRARKIALGLSAAVMPVVWFVPSAPVAWALAIFSLAYFGQQSWSTLVMILPADLFPRTRSAPSPAWSASAARWAGWCSASWSATCSTPAPATAWSSPSPDRCTSSPSASSAWPSRPSGPSPFRCPSRLRDLHEDHPRDFTKGHMARVVQLTDGSTRRVALVDEPTLRVIDGFSSIDQLATLAIVSGDALSVLAQDRAKGHALDYDEVYAGGGPWRLLPPIDHPVDPARCLVSGTGLTHFGSARDRNAMHIGAEPAELTDSLKMFQAGVEHGRPGPGRSRHRP